MDWFGKLCRNAGLAIHHVTTAKKQKTVLRKKVEQEKRGKVTLRRTTIEEIEVDNARDDRTG